MVVDAYKEMVSSQREQTCFILLHKSYSGYKETLAKHSELFMHCCYFLRSFKTFYGHFEVTLCLQTNILPVGDHF